jgi:hypothetical protein
MTDAAAGVHRGTWQHDGVAIGGAGAAAGPDATHRRAFGGRRKRSRGEEYFSAFTQAVADLGWTDGRNVLFHIRWGGGDINRIRALAHELVGLQPEIIVTLPSTPATAALQRETRTIPIVFVGVADPVASGFVARFDLPGGNITGFANFEPTLGGKWLELLLEIAPGIKRAAAIMFNPDRSTTSVYMRSLEAAARSLKVVPITAPVHSDVEIETAIIALGRRAARRRCRHAGCVHGGASRGDHIGGGPKQRTGGVFFV